MLQQKTTLRGLLTRVKGPQKHKDKGVVYQIPCAQCNEVYIGKTGRPLKTRISEHKRAVVTDDVRNANATHWMRTNHNMDWGATHVEGEEDKGKCVHQDQENLQHGLRVFPESSLELPN